MIWNPPHISKVYEALTAIADNRIELLDPQHARCYSSSRGKYYEIEYDLINKAIMSNDNTAYFTGSVSYPMIAMLMLLGEIDYATDLLKPLKGIAWKHINQKFKNDYDKAIEFVLQELAAQGIDITAIKTAITQIHQQALKLELSYLGKKRFPPRAY